MAADDACTRRLDYRQQHLKGHDMNRLEQDAADALHAYELRQERHKRGYAPQPVEPLTGRARLPEPTEQELKERESLPF